MELDLFALASQLYSAVTGGQWPLVAALALMAAVFVLRKFVAPRVPFLASDAGGVLLAFAGAFGLAWSHQPEFSGAVLLSAAKVAFVAMGGYAALKKLLVPAGEWLLRRLGLKSGVPV